MVQSFIIIIERSYFLENNKKILSQQFQQNKLLLILALLVNKNIGSGPLIQLARDKIRFSANYYQFVIFRFSFFRPITLPFFQKAFRFRELIPHPLSSLSTPCLTNYRGAPT
jgi:hypothetical protein